MRQALKNIFGGALLLLGGCHSVSHAHLVAIPDTPVEQRYKIAILDFENATGNSQYSTLIDDLSDSLLNELSKYSRFRIVERKKLQQVLAETKLQMTGITSEADVKQLGHQLGAEAVLFPELISVTQEDVKDNALIAYTLHRKTKVVISARLVDLQSNEVIASAKSSGYKNENRRVAFGVIGAGNFSDQQTSILAAMEPAIEQLANDLAARTSPKRQKN